MARFNTLVLMVLCSTMLGTRADHADVLDQPPASTAHSTLKISSDLLPLQSAQPLFNVTWPDDFFAPDVYCVGDPAHQLERLEFDCDPDCDAHQRSAIRQKTVDYRQIAGYPAIKLSGLMVAQPQKWHGKRLACRGFSPATDPYPYTERYGPPAENVTVFATIRIHFLTVPRILTADEGDRDHEPSMNGERGVGRLFMLADEMTIQCRAEAYPPADHFEWWEGVTKLGEKSQFLRITRDFVGKFVRCEAHNGRKAPKSSDQVLIEKAVSPFMIENNFQNIRESYKNNASIRSSLRLDCSFGAWPPPWIEWFFENNAGLISRPKCNQLTTQDKPGLMKMDGTGYHRANSTCLLELANFNQTGSYWCAGCFEITKNVTVCDTGMNVVPQHALFLNVSGAPIRSEQPTRLERSSESQLIMIYEPFCANPKPLPSDTFLTCEGERISMLETHDGVHLQHLNQISNVPFCYEAWITFSNLESISRSYYCTISIGNGMGTLQYAIPVGTYIASNRTDFTSAEILAAEPTLDNTILALCISLLIFVVCFGAIFAYTWNKRRACFSYRKADNHSDDFGKNDVKEECMTIDKNGALIDNGLECKDTNQVPSNESCQAKIGKNGYQCVVSNEVVV